MRAPLLVLLLLAGAVDVLLFGDLLRGALPARAPAPADDVATHPRCVVVGADGVDHRWLVRYLDEDEARPAGERRLPNLAALRARGGLQPLRSEIPPESPVAWASLLTGVNPARHGVFDFVRPGPDYRPENGMVDVTPMRLLFGKVPIRPPRAASRLRAPTFLERVQAAGYPVLGLRQPMLFPARSVPGARLLAGLGTPDASGGAGFYAVWSSRAGFPAGDTTFGGVQIPLEVDGGPRFETHLPGPFDPALPRGERGERQRQTVPLAFEVLEGRDPAAVAITIGGTTQVIEPGARSDFFHVVFTLATWPPIEVNGHVRFEVKRMDPLVVLSDPVNLYAPRPPLPLTSPPGYGAELWERYGPFETLGWAEQTFQLNDRYQDDASFLRDCLEDMDRGAGILLGELDRGASCVFQLFTATDRALHCFYRYYDELHPAYEAGRKEALGDPMLRVYERLDRIVGDVLGRLGEDDLLLVCSDHGFQTWRWGVSLNRWLVDEGYMVLKGTVVEQNLRRFFDGGDMGVDTVDWSKTRAYALGLGQIYLNRRGREPSGVVEDAEVGPLLSEIRERLLGIRNPYAEADVPVVEVYRMQELHRGPFSHEVPELQLGFAPGYRISWQTALLAGQGRELFEKNEVPWSGDHCSTDVTTVPGVVLANRPIQPASAERPHHVRDIAATVLDFFGVDATDLDARPLPLGAR